MKNADYFSKQKKGYLLRLALLIVDCLPWWLEVERKDIYLSRKSELVFFLDQIYSDYWNDYKDELIRLEREAVQL